MSLRRRKLADGRSWVVEPQRVDELPVGEDFVVEVRARGTARGADKADHVAALDVLPGLDVESAQVTVTRREAEAVLQDNQVAVIAVVGREFDRAVRGRVDRRTFLE